MVVMKVVMLMMMVEVRKDKGVKDKGIREHKRIKDDR